MALLVPHRGIAALSSSPIDDVPPAVQATEGRDELRLIDVFVPFDRNVSDKWEQYLAIYDAELRRFVAAGKPLRLLEIGVQNGGSLQIWSRYLPPGSTITGIDIDPACAHLSLGVGIRILVGDASDSVALEQLLGEERFDVILDDGSHRSDHIITSFEACFPRLAAGGIYVIEDVHCSYFASFGGGFRKPEAAMEYFKALTDALNVDYFEADSKGADAQDLAYLHMIGREIARITFYDSIIVIEKLESPKTRPYRRLISGTERPVVDLAHHISHHMPVPQLRNLALSPAAMGAFETQMSEMLAAQRGVIEVQRDELAAQCALIEAQKNTAADYAQSVDELQREIERLRVEQQACVIEREAVFRQAGQYQASLLETQAALHQALSHVELLRTSSSWRITAPLRMVARNSRRPRIVAHKLKGAAARARGIIERDGTGPTFRRSLEMVRREGLGGLVRKMLYDPSRQDLPRGDVPDVPPLHFNRAERFLPERDPRLDPYNFDDNAARAAAVQSHLPKPGMCGNPTSGLSVVILNRDKPELILPQIDALIGARDVFAERGLPLQILVGDTGSMHSAVLDGYVERESEHACVIVRDLCYQFSDCNNTVALQAEHDVLLFLNNDVIFDDVAATLLALRDAVVNVDGAAIAGLVMQFGDGEYLQHGGVDFFRSGPLRGLPFHPGAREKRDVSSFPAISDVPAVTGACLAVRADIFRRVGGFDTRYAAECQDIDLCLKVRRIGGRCLLVANKRTIHLENATRPKGEENFADRRLFIRRWTSWLEAIGDVEVS